MRTDPDDAAAPEAGEPSLAELLGVLIEDGQTLLEAEAGYWRAAAGYVLGGAKRIAILLVLALFFVFFALMALVVGLLLALGTLIGPWGALVVVTGALALAAWIFAMRAIRRGKRIAAVLTGKITP